MEFIADRPGQVDTHISSTKKAKELLNWSAKISLEEGLRQTIEWCKSNPEVWNKMERNFLVPIQTIDGELIFQ